MGSQLDVSTRAVCHKGHNLGKAKRKRCTGQAWGRAEHPCHHAESSDALRNLLWGLSGGFLPWAQLIKSLPVGDEVQLQPLAPPPRSVGGAERSDPLIPSKAGFPDNQPAQSHP